MESKSGKNFTVLTVILFVAGFVLMSFLLDLCSGAVNRILYEAQKTDPVKVAQTEQLSMLDGRFSMAVPEGMEIFHEEHDGRTDAVNYAHSNASGRTDGTLSVFGYQHLPATETEVLARTMVYDLDGDEGYTYENIEEGILSNGHIIISADKVYENSMKPAEKCIVFAREGNYMVQLTLEGFDQEYANSVMDSIAVK